MEHANDELIKKITDHFETEYSSSPYPLSDDQIQLLISHDCQCDQCGKSIFELYDFPGINHYKEKEILCEDCEKEMYMAICPICEDYFEKALKAEDEIIIVTKAVSAITKAGTGFYQVLSYPYFYSCLVFGFESFFMAELQLIRECDIESMLSKIRGTDTVEIMSGECCHDCVNKYTGKTKLENNYTNKAYGKKHIKLMNEVIKQGK